MNVFILFQDHLGTVKSNSVGGGAESGLSRQTIASLLWFGDA